MRELSKKLEVLRFPYANAGVPDRVFKKHGYWKSEMAKDGYMEDLFHKTLSVTQN